MKKLIATAIASIGIAASAPASAFIVGGIDFGSSVNSTHLETATLAETYVGGDGQTLTAYGQVTTVNGDATYCADGSANCALYYVLSGYTSKNFTGATVQFSGGTINMYYSGAPAINLLNQSSSTNIATITALTPWLQLNGHTFLDGNPLFAGDTQTLNGFGSLTGASLSVTGAGLSDVDLGWGNLGVALALDTNTIGDGLGGFADIAFTASSNNFVLNQNDAIASCQTANPNAGDWCLQGTSNIRGKFIPEPGSLALLGLGLAGLGFRARRKTQQ